MGVPFDKIQNFLEKCRIVPKKNPTGDHLVYPLLLETLKNFWFSASIEPRSPASESLKISWGRS